MQVTTPKISVIKKCNKSIIYIYTCFWSLQRVKASSWCLLVQSQQLKHLNSVWNNVQSNNEDTRATLFWCFSNVFIISATCARRDIQILRGQSVVNENFNFWKCRSKWRCSMKTFFNEIFVFVNVYFAWDGKKINHKCWKRKV